jgi:hypothetical protein
MSLSPEREAEIRRRAAHVYAYPAHEADVELLASVDVPELLAEVERLRRENAGLDDLRQRAIDKQEQVRVELRDRRAEDLDLRGLLAPNGQPRRVPMELGASLVPAVEWLLAENERLRGERNRLSSGVLHFAAEAHRRKWAHDLGEDRYGNPKPSPAFDELHRIGLELLALRDRKPNTTPKENPS